MAMLGFFLKRLGWRTTMILGILGQAVRFGIYAIGSPGPALAGHRQQRRPRLRLRLLLRDGLHLRRRELPQGRPHQRPEPVQPADPGPRPVPRQLPLGLAGRRLQDDGPTAHGGRLRQALPRPDGDWAWRPPCSWPSSSTRRRRSSPSPRKSRRWSPETSAPSPRSSETPRARNAWPGKKPVVAGDDGLDFGHKRGATLKGVGPAPRPAARPRGAGR